MMRRTSKTLKMSLFDGAFYSLMVGTGETYLAAFTLFLGFSQVLSGLVTIVPILIGSMVQFVALHGASVMGSRKKWVVTCCVIQGISLLCFGLLGFTESIPAIVLFLLSSIYWSSGLAAGQTWNIWIGKLVPKIVRIGFFSKRSGLMPLMTILSVVTAGLLLQSTKQTPWEAIAFFALFSLAAMSRFMSAYFLNQHEDIPITTKDRFEFGPRRVIEILKDPRIRNLVVFLFLTQASVQLSAPYFNPYMLKQLHLNYHDYMILVAAALLSRTVCYRALANLGRTYGIRAILLFGAVSIIPLPFLWTITDSFAFLVFVQVLAGISWGAYELGSFLTVLEYPDEKNRSWLLAVINFLNAIGMTVGSLGGAYLLKSGDVTKEMYHHVFVASTFFRILPLFFLPAVFSSMRQVGPTVMAKVLKLPWPHTKPQDFTKSAYFEGKKDDQS